MSISSKPLGAKVVVDGEGLGTTPVIDHHLRAGDHELMLLTHDSVVERIITVGPSYPRSYLWNGQAWIADGKASP